MGDLTAAVQEQEINRLKHELVNLEKLREAALKCVVGEITMDEFRAVINGVDSVKPDNSLMDKVKECPECRGESGYHFEKCRRSI